MTVMLYKFTFEQVIVYKEQLCDGLPNVKSCMRKTHQKKSNEIAFKKHPLISYHLIFFHTCFVNHHYYLFVCGIFF